ncbi:alpha/beta hydrolase [Streptomyces tibetensis]|uniref:alpha/beta hydrolase n=1 Tax=Streptomyces tibetensis TaxID=2382123 RepID=UPI003F4CC950
MAHHGVSPSPPTWPTRPSPLGSGPPALNWPAPIRASASGRPEPRPGRPSGGRLPCSARPAATLGRSGVLLTYEGQGHGSVTSGPYMEDAVNGYLTDLAVPPRGTSCPAVPS